MAEPESVLPKPSSPLAPKPTGFAPSPFQPRGRPMMPASGPPGSPLTRGGRMAAPARPPPRTPNLPPPKAWARSGGSSPSIPTTPRPSIPTGPKPGMPRSGSPQQRAMMMRGHSQSTSSIPSSVLGSPVPVAGRATVDLETATSNHFAGRGDEADRKLAAALGAEAAHASPMHLHSANSIAVDAAAAAAAAAAVGDGVAYTEEEEAPVLPTEEEKRAQLDREKEIAKTAEKSTKQMLRDEVAAFVRAVKMNYLLDGMQVERHVANQKPQAIVIKMTKDNEALKWGLVPARGGTASLSETILVSDIKTVNTNPTFNTKQPGVSFTIELSDEAVDNLDLVARTKDEMEDAVESIKALLGMKLGAKSVREIKQLSDWDVFLMGLEEKWTPSTDPPPVPPAPRTDFITPLDHN